ncbi:MAG: ATP-binding cassette domain-containing protein [Thermodesulfobacteriota bacterium]|nr:ATP-binding cassette domain-containing protein [Thermodesulfobacteriota bacterium]
MTDLSDNALKKKPEAETELAPEPQEESDQECPETPMVSFEKISLRFRKHASLFQLFFDKDRDQDFWALKEVSFSINQGETLGLIGRNGSGKSTLSLVCTKVYQPDRGRVDIRGKVQLLALGVGFQNKMTGRENVYISGSLLGLKKSEIRGRMDEIEAFADIGDFMDEEVRTYSSGMRSRLAFAIATAIRPDILILDEVMATGDNAFREKAMERMKNLHSLAKCAIVVSHSPAQLKQLCQKVIWLEKGRVVMQGEAEKVLNAYQAFCKNTALWIKQHPELFYDLDLDDLKQSGYFRYHTPRYDVLMKRIHDYHRENCRILEVGRSRFAKMAYNFFGVNIDGLGFGPDHKTATGVNYNFDLNDAQYQEKWRKDIPKYDIILFTEVIEHLHTSPLLVLKFLRTLLNDSGVVILQTPNAVTLHRRLQMLAGQNPYNLISETPGNPAHFREYTAAEISEYATQAGFEILDMTFENYFDYRYVDHGQGKFTKKERYRFINILYSMMPKSLRPGMCFVLGGARPASLSSLEDKV